MSIKSKVLAAAATMAMAGGVSAVGLLPADAATEEPTSLGPAYAYGQEYRAPFVLDVLRQGEEAGQPVILFRASSTDPAEDFTIANEGLVSVLATDGLVSSALALNYSTDKAYELEYSPYGVDSGLCVGTGSTAGNGTPVALEACGSSSKTVWVADTADIVASTIGPPATPAYTPLINGV